ncbi:MAG: hypothetical protein AABZ31_15590 [Bdellovibrionota bacterium]
MIKQNYLHVLQAKKTDSDGSRVYTGRGENPPGGNEKENFDGDSQDEAAVLGDVDESSMHLMSSPHLTEDDDRGVSSDRSGLVGPAHSRIETQDLSEEFLDGKVDLVQQMERSVRAIDDAYEGERHDDRQPRI